MDKILVPIFCGCVLPIAIVLINSLKRINNDNQRSKVLIKAIEANNSIDTDKLAEALRKPQKSAREILNLRLLRGMIFTLLGVGALILGIVCAASLDPGDCTDIRDIAFVGATACLAIGISYLTTYYVTRKQPIDNTED